jgi:signal transduction histidine kinase
MVVDLRTATPVVSPSAAAAAIVGDPTATVRYRAADGGWIDSSGAALSPLDSTRRLIPVPDGEGGDSAGLEVSDAAPVPPLLADLAVSTIAARAANERATALADARRRDVRARSRDLVAATDAGRVNLERNLHDGAQQLLVGLALTAGLRVRQAKPSDAADTSNSVADLINQIELVHREVLALVDSAAPAALSSGLAGALRSLAAVCPINSSVDTVGDVLPDDPLALGLYLAAGEVITNAVKHSGASMIEIVLQASPTGVGLLLRDNGIGGVADVPASVCSRIEKLAGTVRIESPVGQGTALRIDVSRSISVVDPR